MSRADPEEDASGCKLVNSGNRMSSDGRDTGARNRDSGANLDAFGSLRRQRHRRIAIGPDHLRVGDPGAVIAELLGITDQFPFIDMSVETDSEFHRDVFSSARAPATASMPFYKAFRPVLWQWRGTFVVEVSVRRVYQLTYSSNNARAQILRTRVH